MSKLSTKQKEYLDSAIKRGAKEFTDLTNQELDIIVEENDYDDVILDIMDYLGNPELYK